MRKLEFKPLPKVEKKEGESAQHFLIRQHIAFLKVDIENYRLEYAWFREIADKYDEAEFIMKKLKEKAEAAKEELKNVRRGKWEESTMFNG